MTEAEWLASDNPFPMLDFVRGKSSDRKLRLFACGCCRRIWSHLPSEMEGKAVTLAERFADGLTDPATLGIASADVWESYLVGYEKSDMQWCCASTAAQFTSIPGERFKERHELLNLIANAAGVIESTEKKTVHESRAEFVTVFAEIFGNPFRPIAADPAWLTFDVLTLANGIYEERAFDRMPILADALQDAGCENTDILNHLRDPNATHVRGCWALDLVLGKE